MRNYIKREISIDGRNIPYPIYTAIQYLSEYDGVDIEDEEWYEDNYDKVQLINQIIAIKQSCYLLRRVSYSCGSLSDDLFQLKLRLIRELQEKYEYRFDDEWMESLVQDEN